MTSNSLSDYQLSPEIILGEAEHGVLLRLAMAGTGHMADDADQLFHELDRAVVVAEASVPADVVRMGSRVAFRTGDDTRTVQLVYPKDADITADRISVLTPIGAALIGLREGQSITWRTRDNRRQALTVIQVTPPPTPDPQSPAAT